MAAARAVLLQNAIAASAATMAYHEDRHMPGKSPGASATTFSKGSK
jgi:hypothetical protein